MIGLRFVLGSVISVAGFSTILFHVTGPAALLVPPLGFFVGGAVAGTAVKRSLGAAVGFGFAFMIGNAVAMTSLIATQAMTGRELLLFGYALTYSIAFAIAGWIGLSAAGVSGRPLIVGVLGFSAGGCATAIILVVLLSVNLIGGSARGVVLGFAIPLMLPWAIGGVALAEALTDEQRRHA